MNLKPLPPADRLPVERPLVIHRFELGTNKNGKPGHGPGLTFGRRSYWRTGTDAWIYFRDPILDYGYMQYSLEPEQWEI